ncbi:MAG TPA: hypothetical protein VGP09_14820 [Caballeronia sp.]|nr:hypothetical protein [Caballeronia sp.]
MTRSRPLRQPSNRRCALYDRSTALAPLGALALEALTQALRLAAFFMPAGSVCRRPAIMVLTHMAGADRQAAIALALVKRMREVRFGCTALAGWQLAEMRRNSRSRLT